MNAVIIYYSLTGKTELVARAIGKTLNAELRRVEDVRKKGILGIISGAISAVRGACGEIKPMDFNIENCDIVFIGSPVWVSRPPPAINTFISKSNFKGKKVVLFVTMRVSGDKRAIKEMSDVVESKGGKIIDSFAIRTGGVDNEKIIEEGIAIGMQEKKKEKDAPVGI